ncbi:3-hydroxyacyl-CoA dehydrogenase family protein [Actinophytocola sp.]|uniref:3-hydroxyacyl-CoA dehydrogenase family protein n=1 Tax=Actinophytocola sp. TaxID=1872138 RepID=UPI003D6B4C8D
MTAPGSPVAVVGAGTMGRGIAIAALRAGRDVTLVDIDGDVLDAARSYIGKQFDRHPAEAGSVTGRLDVSRQLGRVVRHVSVVVEAVPEITDLKLDIFESLRTAPAEALLVSNTSTMSITALADACGGSPRVVGMHFFNPAHRMPLVEVVVGDATSEQTRAEAVALARELGKDPVVVRDVPGFVTSRLGLLLGTEAMRMVQEGVASAADIDKAMRLGYGHPMGPLELADLVGLDARLNNLRSMHDRSGDERYRPPAVLEDLVARGRLGKKSGAGFFTYEATP